MKQLKFLLITLVMVLAFSSCKDYKPEFDFDLTIEANFTEPTTKITGSADVQVHNYRHDLLKASQVEVPEQTEKNAYLWLNDYITENIIKQAPEGTLYLIHINGFLKESTSGITVAVEKTFSSDLLTPKD